MRRSLMVVIAALGLCAAWAGRSRSADGPSNGLSNPFDKDDPQIQALKALQWKEIDFAKQDQKTRCVSLLALNEVLKRLGGKADARLDLLVDYFDQEKLGEAYAGALGEGPEQRPLSYEDAKKVAVAFLKSAMGGQKFGDDLEGCDEGTLRAYERLYEKSARAAYDQGVASRLQVATMGLFLQKQGKFEAFVKWAEVERKKRQAAYEQEMAKKHQDYLETMKKQKEASAAAYAQAQAQRRANEEAARYLERGVEMQEQYTGATPEVANEDNWNGDAYWGWDGAYYSSGAYRGAVADKVHDRYQNWNGNRVNALRGRRR